MTDRLSPQDLNDAQELLTELFTAIRDEESLLSGGTELGTGGNALQGLRETKVSFGNPRNDLIRLTKKLFDPVGVELTELRRRQMRDRFDFYYMTLTVSLRPRRGAQFTRVECALDFGPKGADEPIVQAIFPQSEWKQVLSWGGGMNLALNGNLDWMAQIDVPGAVNLKDLPAHIRAHIADKSELAAFVAVPDFSFKLGRTEIVATGQGNSECFWRIETPGLKETQTIQFGVVFCVPKGTASIELKGLVAAEPSMSWLVTNVRDVFEDLNDKLRTPLRRRGKERLPIGDHEKWRITLPT